jgi:hypothetical protein
LVIERYPLVVSGRSASLVWAMAIDAANQQAQAPRILLAVCGTFHLTVSVLKRNDDALSA